jgi:hypothetical protein
MSKSKRVSNYFNDFNNQQSTAQANLTLATTYDVWYNKFYDIAINQYSYKNLPMGLTTKRLETTIITQMQNYITRDNVGIYRVITAVSTGKLNMYREPIYVMSTNPYYRHEKILVDPDIIMTADALGVGFNEVGIPIYDSYSRNPLTHQISYYARKIAEIEQTLQQHNFKQSIPVFLKTTADEKLSIQSMADSIDQRELYRIVTTGFSESDIVAVDIKYYGKDLYDIKEKYITEFLQFLGIHRPMKEENYIVDEIDIERDINSSFQNTRFNARKEWVRQFNLVFGENLEVVENE